MSYLYSTNTLLVYRLTLQYLGGVFRVYCADDFDAVYNPGHSNPKAIYHLYQHIAQTENFGHPKVQQILEAMVSAAALADITETQRLGLIAAVQEIRATRQTAEFAPVLYIIPRSGIAAARLRRFRAREILGGSASAVEYLISDLREGEFSPVQLPPDASPAVPPTAP